MSCEKRVFDFIFNSTNLSTKEIDKKSYVENPHGRKRVYEKKFFRKTIFSLQNVIFVLEEETQGKRNEREKRAIFFHFFRAFL
jgi:hypothetical protein